MAINLPAIGQVDWGGELNAALTTLDEQTVVDGRIEGDDLVLIANSGAETNVGSVRGVDGEPGPPGPAGPAGPAGETQLRYLNVDDYAQPGDISDTEAWQRAVDFLVANPEDYVRTLTGMKPFYQLHNRIIVKGLQNVVIGGSALQTLIFKPAPTSAGGVIFYGPHGEGTLDTFNVTFSNIELHGGVVSPADGIFDRKQDRTRTAPYYNSFLYLQGNGVPGQSTRGAVDRIRIENVTIKDTWGLPVLIQGASNVEMTGCRIHRCLDTGFTFTKGVRFVNNRVTWSADNGVSLSRGCTQIVCVGNNIEGSYYAGIHLGGFGGDPGPDHVVVSGNTVLNSRQYGISAIAGAKNASITGNVVDGVLRGGASDGNRDHMVDAAGNYNGSGIVVSGSVANSQLGHDFTISGNVVKNADRNGISVGGMTERVTISGNTVTDIGSEFTVGGGTPIGTTHRYYNVAIGSYGLYDSTIKDVVVVGNTVVDTRSAPLINYAVSLPTTRANQRSNYGFNLRNTQTF